MHVGLITAFERESMRRSIAAIRADVAEREAGGQPVAPEAEGPNAALIVAIVGALLIGGYVYSQRRKAT